MRSPPIRKRPSITLRSSCLSKPTAGTFTRRWLRARPGLCCWMFAARKLSRAAMFRARSISRTAESMNAISPPIPRIRYSLSIAAGRIATEPTALQFVWRAWAGKLKASPWKKERRFHEIPFQALVALSHRFKVTLSACFPLAKRKVCRFEKLQRKELIMTPAQPGLEVSAPWTYREKLFNLLAGRDPIEVLGQTASTLADIVARHPAEVLRGRAIQEKWTPNEIIGHLTDSEWVYGYRLRLILCEDEPAILGFRQDAWVASLRHNEREPSELVEIFRTLRVLNLSVWRRMSPEDLQRSGQHNERGAESLAVMVRLLAGHDLSHLHQISRYIQALKSRG